MRTNEERDRNNRTDHKEQPTNNRAASGERGNKEDRGRDAQKTAGRNEGRDADHNRNR